MRSRKSLVLVRVTPRISRIRSVEYGLMLSLPYRPWHGGAVGSSHMGCHSWNELIALLKVEGRKVQIVYE